MSFLDVNGDGLMDFDEFGSWFEKTCGLIERFKAAEAEKARVKAEEDIFGFEQKRDRSERCKAGKT